MYANSQAGQAAATTAAPTLHLGTYRRAIMAVLADEVFTDAERLRANHSVHECQDDARLVRWLTNVSRVREEREAKSIALFEAALERGKALTKPTAQTWATAAQCDEIFALASLPCFTAGEKAGALRGLVTLTQQGAVKEIGQLYATAWRRGALPLYSDGSTRLAA